MTRFASHAFGRRAFLRGAAALGTGALLPLDTRAPFERHTSAEIARLEKLAGRPDPFPK